VTGAGSGIGRQTSLLFAREGAAVTAVDIDAASAKETARLIEKEGGRATAVTADVSCAADCALTSGAHRKTAGPIARHHRR